MGLDVLDGLGNLLGLILTGQEQGASPGSGASEAGTASALLVHAASLENQFVASGYSAEPFGRAIFYGDYVLLGPTSDPAGVMKSAPHDIVSAFEAIAAAGVAGKADFVSRANTSGTLRRLRNFKRFW